MLRLFFTLVPLIVACLSPRASLADRIAYVSSGDSRVGLALGAGSTTTLLEALKDPSITSIVLTSNYTVGSEFDAYVGSPIPITRLVSPWCMILPNLCNCSPLAAAGPSYFDATHSSTCHQTKSKLFMALQPAHVNRRA
jgi:hypothetical protein